jgi:hypothetical protein
MAGIAVAAVAGTRSTAAAVARRSARPPRTIARATPPSLALGMRAAVNGSGAGVLLAASVTAVAAAAATLVFSTSLSRLVSEPEQFGWPYDGAAMIEVGYGGADVNAIAASLDHPDVEGWGLAALSGGLAVNGEALPFVAGRAGFDDLDVALTAGEAPTAGDEIGLGSLTAARLGLEVGDQAVVSSPFGERTVTVTALVVLPPVGPFQADRVGLGTGVLVPEALFEEVMLPDVDRAAGPGSGDLAEAYEPGSFVAIDLRDGIKASSFFTTIAEQLPRWNANGFYGTAPIVYPEPVRPPQISDVADMRRVPGTLTGVFALAMVGGLLLGIAVAARGRSRELALLRSLGCTGRQVCSSVAAQALTVVSVGLALGLPLGVVVGRLSYRAFAAGIGALPDPVVPVPWIVVLMAVTLATGLLASAGPARRAVRARTAEVLRDR